MIPPAVPEIHLHLYPTGEYERRLGYPVKVFLRTVVPARHQRTMDDLLEMASTPMGSEVPQHRSPAAGVGRVDEAMNRIEQLKAEQQERNAKDGGYPSATWLNDALTEALSIAERAVEHLRGFLAAMEWDENARQFLEELETK